ASDSVDANFRALNILPDNKIMKVGDGWPIHSWILGLNHDGLDDLCLATNGIVEADSSAWYSSAVQSDGKILAAGYGPHGYQTFAVARYLTDVGTYISQPQTLNFSLSPNPTSTYINIIYNI